jgi:hypothetical protein
MNFRALIIWCLAWVCLVVHVQIFCTKQKVWYVLQLIMRFEPITIMNYSPTFWSVKQLHPNLYLFFTFQVINPTLWQNCADIAVLFLTPCKVRFRGGRGKACLAFSLQGWSYSLEGPPP